MSLQDHAHTWVFDWENPPGYVCSIAGCDEVTGACGMCEEPSALEFCSEMCASQFEESIGSSGEAAQTSAAASGEEP